MSKLKLLFILLLAIVQGGCSREPKRTGSHLVTVERQSFTHTLYYTGTIQPLKSVVVAAPTDGVIMDMSFQYGEVVKPGQPLFLLSSTKFMTDYKAALLQYVKAKSEFNNNQTLLSESKFLHKNQLISDDDFKMRQGNFYAAQLALMQAKDALGELMRQLDMKDKSKNLYNLTIADIEKINEAMHLQVNSNSLRVVAPSAGIVLFANKSEEELKKLMKGDAVKQGDAMAVVGDMSGVSVRIKVNELTVNQLQPKQKVTITGIAFPEDSLQGEIKWVDRQGELSSSGQPTFTVDIVVPALSPKQRQAIHVGMTAKIEIHVEEAPQLMVPIAAVKEKNGASYLTAYDEKKHISHDVLISAGKTTVDSVAILSGIKPGDHIVVPD
jgi:HlyD family secretion protein